MLSPAIPKTSFILYHAPCTFISCNKAFTLNTVNPFTFSSWILQNIAKTDSTWLFVIGNASIIRSKWFSAFFRFWKKKFWSKTAFGSENCVFSAFPRVNFSVLFLNGFVGINLTFKIIITNFYRLSSRWNKYLNWNHR